MSDMSDDWSLKGKKINPTEKHIGSDGEWHSSQLTEMCYIEEDIETLRQKLIEDYVRYCEDGDMKLINKYKSFQDLINKRFGVEK